MRACIPGTPRPGGLLARCAHARDRTADPLPVVEDAEQDHRSPDLDPHGDAARPMRADGRWKGPPGRCAAAPVELPARIRRPCVESAPSRSDRSAGQIHRRNASASSAARPDPDRADSTDSSGYEFPCGLHPTFVRSASTDRCISASIVCLERSEWRNNPAAVSCWAVELCNSTAMRSRSSACSVRSRRDSASTVLCAAWTALTSSCVTTTLSSPPIVRRAARTSIPLFRPAAIDVHHALEICRGPAQHLAQPGAQNQRVALAHRSEDPASKIAGADAIVLDAPSRRMQQVTPADVDQTDPAIAVEHRCRYRQRVERCLDQPVRVLARLGAVRGVALAPATGLCSRPAGAPSSAMAPLAADRVTARRGVRRSRASIQSAVIMRIARFLPRLSGPVIEPPRGFTRGPKRTGTMAAPTCCPQLSCRLSC